MSVTGDIMGESISFLGNWLAFIAPLVVVPAATIAAFEGTRLFSRKQILSRATANLAFGIVILGTYAGLFYWSASLIDSTYSITKLMDEPRSVPDIQQSALAQMTPAELEEKTRFVARLTFSNTGRLIQYSNANGEQVLYAPSEKEILQRQDLQASLLQTRTMLEFTRIQTRAQVWVSMAALIVAIVSGLSARSRSRNS